MHIMLRFKFQEILQINLHLFCFSVIGSLLLLIIQILFQLVQSNLRITTTWGTNFLRSLWTCGRYKEDLCITAKTVNSDIWSLYKESIIFHLITRYWKKINQRVFSFETKGNVVINDFKTKLSWEFLMTSTISTLCSDCYMQVIKSLGHHLSGRWSRCKGGRYIERSLS